MAGYSSSDAFDTNTLIAFTIGNHLHEYVQTAYKQVYPDFRDEVSWTLPTTTGRADGMYTHPEHGLTILEVKTMPDDKFTEAVESNAPQSEHMLQGDLSALALGASWVDVVYINKGRNKPPRVKKGQQPAQPLYPMYIWHYKADLRHARQEAEKHGTIQRHIADSTLPARLYHGQELEPETVNFPCNWCPFKRVCISDGPGVVPLNRR
jgi:hypothetical protein